MDQAFWDERYRAATRLWSGKPNPQLVAQASHLQGGTALDVGAGEGADAIWLAGQGFEVTAVDISQVALDRAQAHAQQAGEAVASAINWVRADLLQWQPEPAYYDLVSIHFLHLPSLQRDPLYLRLAGAVRPQGTLLIVGHHPWDLNTTVKRPQDPDLLFTPEDLERLLGPDWKVLVSEARPREAKDSEGNAVTVHDSVLVARRL